jgi:hypothetical protein
MPRCWQKQRATAPVRYRQPPSIDSCAQWRHLSLPKLVKSAILASTPPGNLANVGLLNSEPAPPQLCTGSQQEKWSK